MGKPAMRGKPVVLSVNGERVAVPPGGDLSQSLVEFIRTHTRFTVSKSFARRVEPVTMLRSDGPHNKSAPCTHA